MPATAYMRTPHCNENGTFHLYGALKYSTRFYSQPHSSLTVMHLTDEKTEVLMFDQGHMVGKCSGLCTPDLKDHISKLSREGIKTVPNGQIFLSTGQSTEEIKQEGETFTLQVAFTVNNVQDL